MLQPDFGQTMLITLVWGALFYMAGMRFIWMVGLGATAAIGLTAAFYTVPHVAQRINRFLDPASGDTFNIDIATESFVRGGWFGRGPGEGTIKRILPEGHTDFVFAVAAEEFGVVLCLSLVALFAFIVIRALIKAMRNSDPFIRFAAAGLAILFGLQSTINMAVNLHLMPAKGMTLAVRLLWRLVADLARLWHGHADRVDARAPARPFVSRHAARPENRLMPEPGRAPVLARRRRDRRPSVPGRGAGRGAHAARLHRPSGDRPPRRALRRGVRGRDGPRHCQRDLARAQSDRRWREPAAMLGRGFLQAWP